MKNINSVCYIDRMNNELVVRIKKGAIAPHILAQENDFTGSLLHIGKDQYKLERDVILDLSIVGSIGGYEVGDCMERELGVKLPD